MPKASNVHYLQHYWYNYAIFLSATWKKKKQKSSDETKNVRINASQGLCLDVFQIFGY